jgi:hypothetical protein
MFRHLVVAALFAATAPAYASELAPYQAASIQLGSIRGVAYYTEAHDGYRVIATLADGEAGLPVRFEATLADEQSLRISVPGKLGEASQVLEISRGAAKLVVSSPPPAADASRVCSPASSR